MELGHRGASGPPIKHGAELYDADSNGHLAITGGSDGVARLWQVETGKRLREFREGSEIRIASLNHGGDLVETVTWTGRNSSATLWRADNGSQIGSLGFQGLAMGNWFSSYSNSTAFYTPEWCLVQSWNGQVFQLLGAALRQGFGIDGFFPKPDGTWELRRIVPGGKGLLRVPIGQPISAPLPGNPKVLMDDWERRLALTVDPEGRIVAQYSPPIPDEVAKGKQTNTGKAAPTKQH